MKMEWTKSILFCTIFIFLLGFYDYALYDIDPPCMNFGIESSFNGHFIALGKRHDDHFQ